MLRPISAQAMRVEDYVKDGRYVVLAELPVSTRRRNLR